MREPPSRNPGFAQVNVLTRQILVHFSIQDTSPDLEVIEDFNSENGASNGKFWLQIVIVAKIYKCPSPHNHIFMD